LFSRLLQNSAPCIDADRLLFNHGRRLDRFLAPTLSIAGNREKDFAMATNKPVADSARKGTLRKRSFAPRSWANPPGPSETREPASSWARRGARAAADIAGRQRQIAFIYGLSRVGAPRRSGRWTCQPARVPTGFRPPPTIKDHHHRRARCSLAPKQGHRFLYGLA
jgi:hypothetical protein